MENNTETTTTIKSISWTKGEGTTRVTETRETPKVPMMDCGRCPQARPGAVDFGCHCDSEWDAAEWSRWVD